MDYYLSFSKPTQHWLDIEIRLDTLGQEHVMLQLPAWRPGRYQLGNFAANIRHWAAFDGEDQPLAFRKRTKDLWEIDTTGTTQLRVRYQFYANALDAGSTWLDEHQLYVNPVNCLLYQPNQVDAPHRVHLSLPPDYEVATSMVEVKALTFEAQDFQELADSPFIASDTLQHRLFVVNDIDFHLWFQGDWQDLNEPQLENDFRKFIAVQLALFEECPVEEYHFLFQFVPYKAYHGVEHLKSTVIVLGPNYLLSGDYYPELLGVSSHELFHTWNIKAIRPAAMQPYDFSQENYTRLGYVAEGVTTYYGDQLLLRSGGLSWTDYLHQLERSVQRHLDNPARHHYSVAESSFDTWLDGYQKGAPGRKLSIYADGCVLAFITDVGLMQATNNQASLDTVMRQLYQEFGKTGKGYTEDDYFRLIGEIGNTDLVHNLRSLVGEGVSMETAFRQAIAYLGWELVEDPSSKLSESQLGMKLNDQGKIIAVYPGSPADEAGLAEDDVVVALNGIAIEGDFDKWAAYRLTEAFHLDLKRKMGLTRVSVAPDGKPWYRNYRLERKTADNANESAWARIL
ncbi:MAG: M61 family metallopeptidase [Salibacteraceae bacterium]